jgi:hypothetical protein
MGGMSHLVLYVCVGFLYISSSSFVLLWHIVGSRNLKESCCSISIVNFYILVLRLLNLATVSSISDFL